MGVSRARDASYVFSDASSLDVSPERRQSALAELAFRTAVSRDKVSALATGRSITIGAREAVNRESGMGQLQDGGSAAGRPRSPSIDRALPDRDDLTRDVERHNELRLARQRERDESEHEREL